MDWCGRLKRQPHIIFILAFFVRKVNFQLGIPESDRNYRLLKNPFLFAQGANRNNYRPHLQDLRRLMWKIKCVMIIDSLHIGHGSADDPFEGQDRERDGMTRDLRQALEDEMLLFS